MTTGNQTWGGVKLLKGEFIVESIETSSLSHCVLSSSYSCCHQCKYMISKKMVEIQQYSDHQSLPVSGESFLNTKFYFITKCGFRKFFKQNFK